MLEWWHTSSKSTLSIKSWCSKRLNCRKLKMILISVINSSKSTLVLHQRIIKRVVPMNQRAISRATFARCKLVKTCSSRVKAASFSHLELTRANKLWHATSRKWLIIIWTTVCSLLLVVSTRWNVTASEASKRANPLRTRWWRKIKWVSKELQWVSGNSSGWKLWILPACSQSIIRATQLKIAQLETCSTQMGMVVQSRSSSWLLREAIGLRELQLKMQTQNSSNSTRIWTWIDSPQPASTTMCELTSKRGLKFAIQSYSSLMSTRTRRTVQQTMPVSLTLWLLTLYNSFSSKLVVQLIRLTAWDLLLATLPSTQLPERLLGGSKSSNHRSHPHLAASLATFTLDTRSTGLRAANLTPSLSSMLTSSWCSQTCLWLMLLRKMVATIIWAPWRMQPCSETQAWRKSSWVKTSTYSYQSKCRVKPKSLHQRSSQSRTTSRPSVASRTRSGMTRAYCQFLSVKQAFLTSIARITSPTWCSEERFRGNRAKKSRSKARTGTRHSTPRKQRKHPPIRRASSPVRSPSESRANIKGLAVSMWGRKAPGIMMPSER